jgi:hypothetical protein
VVSSVVSGQLTERSITKADGSRITVYVDEQFEVVGVDSR